MRGGSSIFQPLTGPKVLFVPRRPVPMGLGGNAFFARLQAVGAFNKEIPNTKGKRVLLRYIVAKIARTFPSPRGPTAECRAYQARAFEAYGGSDAQRRRERRRPGGV